MKHLLLIIPIFFHFNSRGQNSSLKGTAIATDGHAAAPVTVSISTLNPHIITDEYGHYLL